MTTIQAHMITFNSLYGIPPDIAKKTLEKIDFQFPLWDTYV